MKLTLLFTMLAASIVSFAPAYTFARGGSEGGGGGNELIVEFVATANRLLEDVSFRPEHRELLRGALDRVRITTGPVLLNLTTGEPVPEQSKLIAWGSPGRIQLKEKGILFDASFENALLSGEPIAHIVIHELFRASGALDAAGKSVDENFQLSIGLYGLDRNFARGLRKVRRSAQRLYAECKVTQCEVREKGEGSRACGSDDVDATGLVGGTVQVFKVRQSRGVDQHDGMVSILRALPASARIDGQELLAVHISDGDEEMTILDEETEALLDFSIRYSTRKAPVTKGHVTMPSSFGLGARYLDLTLGSCRTSID
jgi:hypothetical protein